MWVCLPCVLVCVRVCVWCVSGLWLLHLASLGWGLLLVFVWVWLVCVVVGPSPLLAEGPECDSPPLLAGFRCRWWWVFPRLSWLRGPGCGSPPLLAGVRWWWWGVVPRQSWLRVLVAVPRHSWLGSVGCGWLFRGGGKCPVLCVFVARAVACGARAFVCFVCLWYLWWWWCGVGVSSACAGVRACVCVVYQWSFVACPRLSRLGLAAGVCVGVVGVCCGWSLATPG